MEDSGARRRHDYSGNRVWMNVEELQRFRELDETHWQQLWEEYPTFIENPRQSTQPQSAVDAIRAQQLRYNVASDQLARNLANELERERQINITTSAEGMRLFEEALREEAGYRIFDEGLLNELRNFELPHGADQSLIAETERERSNLRDTSDAFMIQMWRHHLNNQPQVAGLGPIVRIDPGT